MKNLEKKQFTVWQTDAWLAGFKCVYESLTLYVSDLLCRGNIKSADFKTIREICEKKSKINEK